MQNTQDLQLAPMPKRAFAFVIDDLLVTFIVLAIFWDSLMGAADDMDAMMFLVKVELVMPLIFLKVIYQTFFVWYYGATIGKIITKIGYKKKL